MEIKQKKLKDNKSNLTTLENELEELRERDFSQDELRRVDLALGCNDCEDIPKTREAGDVIKLSDNITAQRMHNGILVIAGGYHGSWMMEIIRKLKGHHEPQEEKAFHEIINILGQAETMIELGSFWSYYSLWFLKEFPNARTILVEPDPYNLKVGKANYELNKNEGEFIQALVGAEARSPEAFTCESDGESRAIRQISVDSLVKELNIPSIDILFADIQGAETDMLEGIKNAVSKKLIRYVFISTHHYDISGDYLTHQKCLNKLEQYGAHIIVEHTVEESFSGDGLIVASFEENSKDIEISLSRCRHKDSLFGSSEDRIGKLAELVKSEKAQKKEPDPVKHSVDLPTDLTFDKASNIISYAQNFEDVMLWRALKHIKNGCYVDVGANDPIIDSVSKLFYDQGWKGIHIEPVPLYAKRLREKRPDEEVLEIAISDQEGSSTFYVIGDTGLSTLDKKSAQQADSRGYRNKKITVPTLPLHTAIKDYISGEVHWLKIDVEGFEKEVLKGWDPKILRPWIILLEAVDPTSLLPNHEDWESILLNADYLFVYFDGLNRFYIAKEHPELINAFASPPNVFDEIPLSGLSNSLWCQEMKHTIRERENTINKLEKENRLLQDTLKIPIVKWALSMRKYIRNPKLIIAK